ncbi:LysR family transcriptional regulator [Sulfitobacter sp. HNIBRBA2951]|uniref:LysR family transcriptional regulator n=1 Tax=Sulfitobacter aquimarinus TaxID=3158557 RepID=UPI0032DF6642
MSHTPSRKSLSFKSLELFQICARKGSLLATAKEARVSVSTVSHHLRSLEEHLGVALFDHARKPMVLTAKGHAFLRNIDGALHAIRQAQAEATAGNLSDASFLRLGTIEDFDSDVIPDLAVFLSDKMPSCDFVYHTASSHEIIAMLRNRELDLGITTTPPERFPDLQDRPLLRDPFVVVLPAKAEPTLADVVEGKSRLPFLQFASDLIIADQIAAQLRRIGIALPHKFQSDSNKTLMAMVAAGAGWTITTPLLFSHARRFHPALRMHPFPAKRFSRTLSLVSTPDCSRSVLELVDRKARSALMEQIIGPLHDSTPWLKDSFGLID